MDLFGSFLWFAEVAGLMYEHWEQRVSGKAKTYLKTKGRTDAGLPFFNKARSC